MDTKLWEQQRKQGEMLRRNLMLLEGWDTIYTSCPGRIQPSDFKIAEKIHEKIAIPRTKTFKYALLLTFSCFSVQVIVSSWQLSTV